MSDYWQFSKNDCKRSGVNLTRSDFEKLGTAITGHYENPLVGELDLSRDPKNVIKAVAEYTLSLKK